MFNFFNLIPSVLHTKGKEIDISQDLQSTSTKTIAELLDEQEKKEKNKKDQK
jgi:hypothetical protein